MAHPVDRALEDRHLRAEAERHDRGVVADDPAADDHDPPGSDAGHAAEQQPAAAERLLEEVRARLRREPAGDLRHRREQRQRAARGLDRLVGDRGHARVDERPRQRLVGGDVEVGEERQPLAEPPVLGRDRLLHLEQQLARPPDVVDRARCARRPARRRRRRTRCPPRRPSRQRTSWPRLISSSAPAGVSATRYSSDLISLATPILTARDDTRGLA